MGTDAKLIVDMCQGVMIELRAYGYNTLILSRSKSKVGNLSRG